jgi:hypothetical protein
MSERTYKAKDYGPNGWGVSTYIDGRFSQTLFGFTEGEAIGMAARYNKLEKEGLDPSDSKKSLHQLYLGRPMG